MALIYIKKTSIAHVEMDFIRKRGIVKEEAVSEMQVRMKSVYK